MPKFADPSARTDLPRLRPLVEDAWRRQVDLVTDLSVLAHEPGDDDTETRRLLDRTLEHARWLLAELDEALGRLADGSYGTCAGCARPIPFERLEAVPAARFCVRCTPSTG